MTTQRRTKLIFMKLIVYTIFWLTQITRTEAREESKLNISKIIS